MGVTIGDAAALAVRAGIGATVFAHGTQKLFGWFNGGGPEGTAQAFHGMGYRPGRPMALTAGASEAAGGAALVLGLGTPAAGAAVAGTMAVAAELHAPNGFFNTEGGLEYPALIALTALSIAASGPGRLSLDHLTGGVLDRPWMRAAACAAVVPAVALVVARKRRLLAREAEAEAVVDGDGADTEGAD
ncbi:DoxX family protein [Streptomonospora nanhaiensis]|uniref:Putative oxidoreductase n=1 Tax=Streptomonospora nanhaiensis TaxID=1323731 RepID=A0A853BNL4_9ACTN|nr:DoxX family protein [Streptomonospora nanhaiensis]NYI96216.1 putative oxidoreductase [Streptomonospora nanhaiensis]